MKKITLFLLTLFTCWQIDAQVNGYGFSQSAGTFTPITGGTVLATPSADNAQYSVVLPTAFTFNGTSFTDVRVSSNGFITFGTTNPGTANYSPISSTTAYAGSISAYGRDLNSVGAGSETRWQQVGNEIIFQWLNVRRYNISGEQANFQIRLNTSNNEIKVVYGVFVAGSNTAYPQVGLRGATNADYNNRTAVAGTGDWINSTAGGSNASTCYINSTTSATIPSNGLTYTWTAPSCVAPGGFAASAITTNSATISWSAAIPAPATGYEYYYSNVNTAPSGAGTATTAITANLTPLALATVYYVWLRSDCGGTFSAWNGPFTFTTNCNSITALPHSESFDAVALPTCWSTSLLTGTTNWASDDTNDGVPSPHTGTRFMGKSWVGNDDALLVSPVYNLTSYSSDQVRLNVWIYRSSDGLSTDRTTFYANTNPNITGATQLLDVSLLLSVAPTEAADGWYNYTVVIPNTFITSGDFYIIARGRTTSSFSSYSIGFDDYSLELVPATPPTCSTITAPVNAALNVTNSRVTWTASLDATSYKIFAGTSSGATDVLNGVNTLGLTTYVVPTDPGSTYFVKIVPFNATGDAVGCTEISFTTCDALVPEFIETFSTFLPSCWQSADNGNLTTGPATFGTSGWVADGFANAGTAGAIRYELWLASANDWVISPIVSIPVTGYELKFDAAATQYFATTAPTTAWEADDFVEVLVSTTGFTNWTVLYTYNNTNVPAPTGTANVIDLDAYAGQDVRFAFRAVEGATDGSADIDFFIDNFEVRLTPSSVPVCATNIVATPNATCGNFANTITWNAVSGADGYRVTVGATSGGTTIANNVNIGNTTTYSFVGNVGTTYYYTIVPFNAAGSAVGCTENSFATVATSCYCPSTPTSVDGLGITGVQIGSTTVTNTVSSSPVYSNNTTPIDMFQGISNNVQVSFDTDYGYSYHVVIWVDANDNYTFEPSEIVYTGVSLDDPTTTLNASFVMPLATPLGNHRMRIVATYDQQIPSNPCYGAFYGETVDFIVNVVATASTDSFDNARFVAYPNPVKDVLNLSYTSEISTVRVLNLLGQEVVSKAVNATSTQVDMSQLSAGTYIVNVTVGDSIKSIKVIKQ